MHKWLISLFLTLTFTRVGMCVEDSNEDLVIALVADINDKYSEQDNFILDGANFFMKWCDENGGFQYGNYTRKVFVNHTDASGFTSQDQTKKTTDAYNAMIQNSTLVLSPISTPRTQAAIAVSENHTQINLAVGASADILFNSGFHYLFSTVVPTSQIPDYTLSQFIGKAKNYILLSTNDPVSVSVTTSVQTYMTKNGISLAYPTQQLTIAANSSNIDISADINAFFQKYLSNVTADLFVCTFPPDDFSNVALYFQTVKPNVKAAAYVLPLTRTVEINNVGEYWVGATQFDPSTPYGIPNQFGGTSAQFNAKFMEYFGTAPDPYAATAAAALMAYYVAVKAVGTVQTEAVAKSLVNMSTFNSFLGDINFYPNGSSVYAKYLTFQFLGGSGQFLNSSNTLVYPAPWSWVAPPAKTVTHSKTLSIVLGVFAGICIILALAALLLLVVKKEYFRRQGIVYCFLIQMGVLFTFVAALTVLPTPTDSLCLAFPWLLGVGFTLVFGNLFIKTWVLFRIFRAIEKPKPNRIQSLSLTVAYIVRLIVAAVLVEVVFLIIWSTVDPPRAELKTTYNHNKQLMCTPGKSYAFWGIFIGYKGIWLLAGVIIAFLTRNIREEYNESKNIVLSIYNCTVILIVAVILAFILHDIPAAIVLIQVITILVAFTFTFVVLFSTPFTTFVKMTSEFEMTTTSSSGSKGSGEAKSGEKGFSSESGVAGSGVENDF